MMLIALFLCAFATLAISTKEKRNAFTYSGVYPSLYTYSFPYIAPMPPLTAVAELRSRGEETNDIEGKIMFVQSLGGPVIMYGNITGLSPGAHGMHVHEFGDITEGCKSMGAHYNPAMVNHGGPADPYRHVGDIGNVKANEDGMAMIHESDHLISLSGPQSIIGRGLVIHQNKDDFGRGGDRESLRTGNAGNRLACGIIAWAMPTPPHRPSPPDQNMDQKDMEITAEEINP